MTFSRWMWINLGAVAAYLVLGKICIELGTIGGTASPFWLPAGLVTALSLRLGYGVLPGIFLGEFLLGFFSMPGPLWKHLMISVGNVLEGSAVILLAPRLMNGTEILASVRNLFAFFISAIAGSACNALLGVGSLWLAGIIPLAAFSGVMLNWSIGDLGGTLIVAPLLLAFAHPDWRNWRLARWLEYGAVLATMALLTWMIFSDFSTLPSAPLAFLLLPFLMWGAFRFGRCGTALLNAVLIALVIWGTTHGLGPFATASATESLVLIQLFTSVLIVTSLVVLIVNGDRQRMNEQLRREAHQLEHEVTKRTLDLVAANQQLLEEITERQRAEAALQALNDTLEQRVQEEAAKNREKDHLLIRQSRLAAMGEMIGNIAHQWRQPLNALGLVIANIKDAHEHGELDDAFIDKASRQGRQLVAQMSKTIDDFRNFFRPNREISRFSLNQIVRDAAALVETTFAHNRIEIRFEEMPDLLALGHPNELAQVLLNLFNNARDAILALARPDGRVTVRVYAGDGRACVEIRDNGGGVPADVLPKIFDPYFTTKAKGTGIGLYMSKMIMENMDGEIAVRNHAEGAQFTLDLPLAG
ncbi:MAG: MASE1 domain-containing protein [Sulfuricella sp.]|nr:MASE1 domain-containing protein [Sulfuricella sp.]